MIAYLQYGVKTSSLYGSKAVINECRLEDSCNTDISTCLHYECYKCKDTFLSGNCGYLITYITHNPRSLMLT